MTQKSRAAILTEIGTLLADNTSQDISPDDVRTVVQDINDSFMLNTSLTRAALQALMSGVTVEVNSMYTVTNAVGATKVIVVFGKTTSTISTLAMNLTDNTFGNYNISADTYYASIVTFKKSFSAAECLAGIDYAIVECPAPGAGYAWEVLSVCAKYTYGTVDYDTIQITVRADTGGNVQFIDDDIIAYKTSNLFFNLRQIVNVAAPSLVENDPLYIQIAGSSQGDGTLIVYGTARLITL